jgi:non-specific serine/threonine protein kinase
LALEAARANQARFSDGVILVELADLGDRVHAARAVASTLGVLDEPDRPIIATLSDVLRARQLLLVLDNCEQAIASCAETAERLLRACPGLRMLATSREPLQIAGETNWVVPSLSLPTCADPPGTDMSVEQVLESEAACLFVERARSAAPGLEIMSRDLPAIARICRYLDGIPLALELAAARVSTLSIQTIAERLDDRFSLLTAGSRTALPRHRTLRALIDSSYELLSRPERVLLAQLSVFAGGWTLEAAEAVATVETSTADDEPTDILALLPRLVARSLVQADRRRGEVRYRLLDTVRQYAQEKLVVSGDERSVRERHRDHFLALAEQAEQALPGPAALTWLELLEAEHDNLRAALDWCEQEAESVDTGLRIASALVRFWDLRGYSGEGRERLLRLLGKEDPCAPARATALRQAGHLSYLLGDSTVAGPLLEESLQVARTRGDLKGEAAATQLLVGVALLERDVSRAEKLSELCDPLWQATGTRAGRALWLMWRAYIARERQEFDLAARSLEEALAIARADGDLWATATFLRALGAVEVARGHGEHGLSLVTESLALRRDLGHKRGVTDCLEGLASAESAIGRLERAARLLGAAEARREDSGEPLPLAWRGDHERALSTVQAGLDEVILARCWAEGRGMPPVLVMEYALGSGDVSAFLSSVDAPIEATPGLSLLTQREREVVALVGRGLKNREIAERLVITEGTAALHVKHALRKLGFATRAQIAAWTVQQQLLGPGRHPAQRGRYPHPAAGLSNSGDGVRAM